MSREIKFRAWDVVGKCMMYFENCKNGIEYSCGELVVSSGYDSYDNPTYEESKDEWEILQYSGLKDIDGKEIYEGDIVYLPGYGNYEVEFPFLELYDCVEYDIGKIAGNIYENPELMGQKE